MLENGGGLRRIVGQSASSRMTQAPCAGRRSSNGDCVSSSGARGIRQHEGEALGRIVRVERQIGAAGLEDADEADDHLQRALDAQPHHRLGTDAECAQMMRQLARARVELRLGETLDPRTRRRSRRGSSRTCAANSSGKVADGIARAVSFQSERMVRRSSAPRTSRVPIGWSGSATAAASSRIRRAAIASTLARSNRSVAYSRLPAIPAGAPSAPRCSASFTDKSNLALAEATGSSAVVSPGQLEVDSCVVLQHQHHLEQRMPRQRARRVDHLDQALERQILVAVGRQVARAHPRDQLAEARIARRVRAQHQRVDEEADEIVERAVGAAGDRAADRNVVARCPAG